LARKLPFGLDDDASAAAAETMSSPIPNMIFALKFVEAGLNVAPTSGGARP
jgi:hypothetical protein